MARMFVLTLSTECEESKELTLCHGYLFTVPAIFDKLHLLK